MSRSVPGRLKPLALQRASARTSSGTRMEQEWNNLSVILIPYIDSLFSVHLILKGSILFPALYTLHNCI